MEGNDVIFFDTVWHYQTTAIKLLWSKVTGYRVDKYNSKNKKYKKFKEVTATSLTISKLTSGTKYKFKVRAYTKTDSETVYSALSSVKGVKVK